jgi:hypothetical protein
VVAGSGLCGGSGHAGGVFGQMLGDDDGEVGGGKEEGLISEKAGDSSEWHWTAVAGELRKCITFCNTVGIPCHSRIAPDVQEVSAPELLGVSDAKRRITNERKPTWRVT